ncbi:hypothetical protein PVAG01_10329 [Phlyctema vagabunda]|uniref:Zn(2)-C6 fungal-type domain-containing protein n=1 Tax=Phlyctema vagabunda TaxID=108571 RepID=A0ABR4P5Q2_9HELO
MTKVTRPKIKGCYNCSQRRIDCDRTEPTCLKCTAKGLTCSGLGIRYRFNAGLAARGKLVGRTLPLSAESGDASLPTSFMSPVQWTPEGSSKPETKSYTSPAAVSRVQKRRAQRSRNVDRLADDHTIVNIDIPSPSSSDLTESTMVVGGRDDGDAQALALPASPASPLGSSLSCSTVSTPTEIFFCGLDMHLGNTFPLSYGLETHDSLTRMLFANFSKTVAAEMAVFDGPFNRYRSIVLPLAAENELVRNAVLATSANQLGSKDSSFIKLGIMFQDAVIKCLSKNPGSPGTDTTTILAALVILLINDMVSGGTDYRILYKMWYSCLSIGEKSSSPDQNALMSFLHQQFRVLEYFMQPYLGDGNLQLNISTRFPNHANFIAQDSIHYPEYAQKGKMLEGAFEQACDLYLQRALGILPAEETMARVQKLKETVEHIPQRSVGEHALVWVYFISAAESSTEEHRTFFRGRLLDIYSRSGFSNVLCSLKILDGIWKSTDKRWTNILTDIDQVFVF